MLNIIGVASHFALAVFISNIVVATSANNNNKNVFTPIRRILNFSNTFGSATRSKTPYDRIAGHPVFQITTPWGSPYMNMEKLSDLDEQVASDMPNTERSSSSSPQSISEEQNEYRTVALYFMDPDDALAVHAEMKQMDQMESADMRIMTTSLSKAFRQASNLGRGLVTGVPVDDLDGKLPIRDGGASLRHKIVPPKRQLYYAARCVGKERVGLFGESNAEDAQNAVMGNSALEGMNLARRREKRERKTKKKQSSPMRIANAHMEGYTGIPVFYTPELQRRVVFWKRWINGSVSKKEIPLFFNYEDMMEAWADMRNKYQKKRASTIPMRPPDVEVFNLWDILTSIERETWKNKHNDTPFWKWKKTSDKKQDEPGLESIVFIPSSRSIQYKEGISALGNGKARLRPMR